MTYTINVNLGGVQFGIIEETYNGALEEFGALGGNADLLGKMLPDAFESSLSAPARESSPAPARSSKPASEDSDWNSDGPWSGSEGSAKPERTDPWDDEPVEDSKPARTRSGPSRGNSRPARPSGSAEAAGEVQNKVDKFGRTWTLGLPDAPNCHCGVPAARMKGKGRDSGKAYTKFKCAKGAPDGDWRDKCDYDEFPPR